MKLLRHRRKPAAEFTEPDPEPAESAAAAPIVPPALLLTAYSRSGLPDEEFSVQTAMLRRILSYDGDTRSWCGRLGSLSMTPSGPPKCSPLSSRPSVCTVPGSKWR